MKASQGVKKCFSLSRLGFHPEMITQVVCTLVWTLTVMRTSTLSLTVSVTDSDSLQSQSVLYAFVVLLHGVFSYSTAFRAQQGEVLRHACRLVPLEAFQIAAEWLQYQIASPIDPGDTTCKYLYVVHRVNN